MKLLPVSVKRVLLFYKRTKMTKVCVILRVDLISMRMHVGFRSASMRSRKAQGHPHTEPWGRGAGEENGPPNQDLVVL